MAQGLPTSRRTFLSTAGAAAAALAAGAHPARAQSADKLRVALIGVGGRGGAQLKGLSGEQIVALCDVNEDNLARAAAMFPKARTNAPDAARFISRPSYRPGWTLA